MINVAVEELKLASNEHSFQVGISDFDRGVNQSSFLVENLDLVPAWLNIGFIGFGTISRQQHESLFVLVLTEPEQFLVFAHFLVDSFITVSTVEHVHLFDPAFLSLHCGLCSGTFELIHFLRVLWVGFLHEIEVLVLSVM